MPFNGSQSSVRATLIVSTGGVVSSTVTSNWHESEFPAESVTVHVTVVVPSGNVLPEGGTHTSTGAGSHVSETAGSAKVTTAPPPPVHSAVTSPGHVIVGAVVSSTVTVCVHVAIPPAPLSAVTTTVCTPIEYVCVNVTVPDEGPGTEPAIPCGGASPAGAPLSVNVTVIGLPLGSLNV
jgi:hypothetical protein